MHTQRKYFTVVRIGRGHHVALQLLDQVIQPGTRWARSGMHHVLVGQGGVVVRAVVGVITGGDH